jgi:hypothetical protein
MGARRSGNSGRMMGPMRGMDGRLRSYVDGILRFLGRDEKDRQDKQDEQDEQDKRVGASKLWPLRGLR